MAKELESLTAKFSSVTVKALFPYQAEMATADDLPKLLEVPTGAGKTAAAPAGVAAGAGARPMRRELIVELGELGAERRSRRR